MDHIHWVPRQNKLETRKEKDEVKKREVHECDDRVLDPDVMVDPPTPKPTCKAEGLARAMSTIVSSCEGNSTMKKWDLPRFCGGTHHTQITHPPITRIRWRVRDPDANIYILSSWKEYILCMFRGKGSEKSARLRPFSTTLVLNTWNKNQIYVLVTRLYSKISHNLEQNWCVTQETMRESC
jgi:hypothetical protein